MPVGHLGKSVFGARDLEPFFFIQEHSFINTGEIQRADKPLLQIAYGGTPFHQAALLNGDPPIQLNHQAIAAICIWGEHPIALDGFL